VAVTGAGDRIQVLRRRRAVQRAIEEIGNDGQEAGSGIGIPGRLP
jgi:hypothetical protein